VSALALTVTTLGISQTAKDTLDGVVTDQSVAVLPQAQLTIINGATEAEREVTADTAGPVRGFATAPGAVRPDRHRASELRPWCAEGNTKYLIFLFFS